MKKPIAIAAAVVALAAAGTAVAAPGGGVFGGGQDDRQAEFASDLARKLDGVNAAEVERGLEQIHAEREAEMLDERARALAAGLDGVGVDQARTALESVHESLQAGERPDPEQMDARLAEELGVSEADLQKARETEAQKRLDQAVEDGMVTEDQAAEIQKKIDAGELPPPGGPHGGPVPGGPDPGGPGGPAGPGDGSQPPAGDS